MLILSQINKQTFETITSHNSCYLFDYYRLTGRKLSPTNNRLTPEASIEKEISDDEDPSELKLQIELSEQQLSVLRKKVEELETDNGKMKKKTKELQDKLNTKTTKRNLIGDKENNTKLKVIKIICLSIRNV